MKHSTEKIHAHFYMLNIKSNDSILRLVPLGKNGKYEYKACCYSFPDWEYYVMTDTTLDAVMRSTDLDSQLYEVLCLVLGMDGEAALMACLS